jgi:hypothetical protein
MKADTAHKSTNEGLQALFDWLKEVIGWRIEENELDFAAILIKKPVPKTFSNAVFSFLKEEYALDEAEPLVALSRQVLNFIPEF